jgi:UDP-N-acetylglucosamine--N-acetylmuramyl-(pentapeptide) pyrophosphoryl-undecaprenol N-acetylglucosamine transferase
MVSGGSQGAHSINRAVAARLQDLLAAAVVIHITGSNEIEWVRGLRSELSDDLQARYHVYEYLHDEMVDVFLAADLAVSRAGASILGELPAAGLPAVLVPYPYAGAHQWANARVLADAGAALTMDDADLDRDLVPVVLDLLGDHHRRDAMARAAASLARPDAAERIARELRGLAYDTVG